MMTKLKVAVLDLLFLFLYHFFRLLPEPAAAWIGRQLGHLLYLLKVRKKVISDNLTQALGSRFAADELEEIIKSCYLHFGQVMIEFFLIERLPEQFSERVEIENKDIFEQALASERGIIIYSAHFGNWEWLAAALAAAGLDFVCIAREQSLGSLDERINQIRENVGIKTVPATGAGIKESYSKLQDGKGVWILGDQHASGNQHILDFFGRPASVHRGAVRLAAKTGAVILPVFSYRESFGRYRMKFYPIQEIPKRIKRSEEPQFLGPLLAVTEAAILEAPEQWFWFHRRWKVKQGED
ncbi:MAG: lysophospholipid acyltransferase family protein [Bacillota bacterium]